LDGAIDGAIGDVGALGDVNDAVVDMTLRNLSEQYARRIARCARFQESLAAARAFSSGKIYAIGGTIYRRLVGQEAKDDDFLVDDYAWATLPGWELSENRFGGPILRNGAQRVDITRIADMYQVQTCCLEATIKGFLQGGTPLDIQAIAYDFEAKLLIGPGLDAIMRREVRILNRDALWHAKKPEITEEAYAREKVPPGFTLITPPGGFLRHAPSCFPSGSYFPSGDPAGASSEGCRKPYK
jgi:hypothetical protein